MTFAPFPEWKPDISDYQGASSLTIQNVLPRGDGYGPFPDFQALSSALPAACRGYFFARKADGSVAIFAGTSTKLYILNATTLGWTDASLGASTYSALSAAYNWSFVQFNNLVFASQQNAVLQVWDLTSSTAFANALGSPPQASYVTNINRFLVLSGLLSSPYRVQWSGLNNVNASTSWDNVTAQSNFQDMADGGLVRGVSGGDQYGIVFQDSAVRSMTFNPGSAEIFDFYRVSSSDGIFAPQSAVNAAGQTFFISTQGFKVIAPGGSPVAIGKEKFDRKFFADVDVGNLQLCMGAADPKSSRVYWCYKSQGGQANLFDKIIIYDYGIQRATQVSISGEYLSTLAKPGLTLENLDAISGSIDALTFSLDSISTAALSQLSGVNSGHAVGFYAGSNLAATLQTAEQGGMTRMRVRGVRPATDASGAFLSIAVRENQQTTAVVNPVGVPIGADGLCPMDVSTRYARVQFYVPYGSTWTYATGVEPDIVPEGSQ